MAKLGPSAEALMSVGLSAEKAQLLQKPQSTDNITTPTAAELTAAFGSPSTVGRGFIGTTDDNGAGSSVRIIVSDGTSYFYSAALTVAS